MRRTAILLATVGIVTIVSGCGKHKTAAQNQNAADLATQNAILEKLLDAKSGDVITIPAGVYHFDSSISLTVDGVTVRGEGMDKTVLDFTGQTGGAEGFSVHASNFTIEDIGIINSKGDALKVNEGQNIIIRRVRADWTNGPSTQNGPYGLYPVQTKNLLVEDCYVRGASDAGIYVGQSQNIVVRHNRAVENVAGIEIENSSYADVYDNEATKNTGGILVFNMPNLPVPGHSTRVFHNHSYSNNTANFGARGTAVSSVPAGTGIIINANKQVEIFDNDIGDNATGNIIIASYFSTGFMNPTGVAAAYDPYPEAIYIYGNRFTNGGYSPDGVKLKTAKLALFGLTGNFPDVIFDGYIDPKLAVNGVLPPQAAICVNNPPAEVLNADGPHDFKGAKIDTAAFKCDLPKMPPVILTGPLAQGTPKA